MSVSPVSQTFHQIHRDNKYEETLKMYSQINFGLHSIAI